MKEAMAPDTSEGGTPGPGLVRWPANTMLSRRESMDGFHTRLCVNRLACPNALPLGRVKGEYRMRVDAGDGYNKIVAGGTHDGWTHDDFTTNEHSRTCRR